MSLKKLYLIKVKEHGRNIRSHVTQEYMLNWVIRLFFFYSFKRINFDIFPFKCNIKMKYFIN